MIQTEIEKRRNEQLYNVNHKVTKVHSVHLWSLSVDVTAGCRSCTSCMYS
jgi:hypothetical protein